MIIYFRFIYNLFVLVDLQGHYEYPDPSKWSDEELGVLSNEVD